MRSIVIAGAVAAAMALGGCSTTGGGIPIPSSDQVARVQEAARTYCSFVPTASTVLKIITTFTGGGGVVDVVSAAAMGICDAVTKKSLNRRGRVIPPKFRGVTIKGKFQR